MPYALGAWTELENIWLEMIPTEGGGCGYITPLDLPLPRIVHFATPIFIPYPHLRHSCYRQALLDVPPVADKGTAPLKP